MAVAPAAFEDLRFGSCYNLEKVTCLAGAYLNHPLHHLLNWYLQPRKSSSSSGQLKVKHRKAVAAEINSRSNIAAVVNSKST
jgi:hypothetical protein